MGKVESQPFLRNHTLSTGRASNRRRVPPFIAILAAALLLLVWTTSVPIPQRNGGERKTTADPGAASGSDGDNLFVDWDAIPPSQDLVWLPCYRMLGPTFLCTRLTVPLDYSRPLNSSAAHPKVHIALVMLPGQNHGGPRSQWSESPLLLNPGGPGGEGTSLALTLGPLIQTIVGPEHDVIGFDPRGIGGTTPAADCFLAADGGPPTAGDRNRALLHRLTWMVGDRETGLPGASSDGAADRIVQRHRAFSKLCGTRDGEDSILRHAGTPHVARDMLSIVQAWDRWTGEGEPADDTEVADPGSSEPETGPPSTRGKLVYWGFSYGTVLGATFASMFPDHVGRMVLDGVVNTDEYFFGNSWVNATRDADRVLDKLFVYCHRAGDECALHRPDDEVEDIRARFDSLMDRLRDEPVFVVPRQASMPGMITHSDIKALVFSVLYNPLVFPVIARFLDELYREREIGGLISPADLAPLCAPELKLPTYPTDGGLAVLCSDQHWIVNYTKPGLEDLLDDMGSVSSFADVIFTVPTRCSAWEVERADPPFIDWDAFPIGGTDPIRTSFPILFVSNTLDPITPRHSGLWQTRNFAGSGFIEQLSEGHCSVAFVSLCTAGKIRDYFNEGVVPSPPRFDRDGTGLGDGGIDGGDLSGNWTTCATDEFPWNPVPPSATDVDTEDFQLMRALKELQLEFRRLHRVVEPPRMFERLFDMEEEEVAELLELARLREVKDPFGEL